MYIAHKWGEAFNHMIHRLTIFTYTVVLMTTSSHNYPPICWCLTERCIHCTFISRYHLLIGHMYCSQYYSDSSHSRLSYNLLTSIPETLLVNTPLLARLYDISNLTLQHSEEFGIIFISIVHRSLEDNDLTDIPSLLLTHVPRLYYL